MSIYPAMHAFIPKSDGLSISCKDFSHIFFISLKWGRLYNYILIFKVIQETWLDMQQYKEKTFFGLGVGSEGHLFCQNFLELASGLIPFKLTLCKWCKPQWECRLSKWLSSCQHHLQRTKDPLDRLLELIWVLLHPPPLFEN